MPNRGGERALQDPRRKANPVCLSHLQVQMNRWPLHSNSSRKATESCSTPSGVESKYWHWLEHELHRSQWREGVVRVLHKTPDTSTSRRICHSDYGAFIA